MDKRNKIDIPIENWGFIALPNPEVKKVWLRIGKLLTVDHLSQT